MNLLSLLIIYNVFDIQGRILYGIKNYKIKFYQQSQNQQQKDRKILIVIFILKVYYFKEI